MASWSLPKVLFLSYIYLKLIDLSVKSRIENEKKFVRILGDYGFKLEREDKSNTHFVMFFMKKFRDCTTATSEKKKRPDILFRPCQYKKRWLVPINFLFSSF